TRSASCAAAPPRATSDSSTASRRPTNRRPSWSAGASRTRPGAAIATPCHAKMKDKAPFFRVALTGNAAAGKSTVAGLLAAWGAPVIDADMLARDAVAVGSPGLAAVAGRFGAGILTADGSLDRPALRRRVMADPDARAALNAIVHPIVARLAAEAEAALEA